MPDPDSLARALDEQRIRRAVEARLARQSFGYGEAHVPGRAILTSDPAVRACMDRGHYPDFWALPPRCRTCGDPYPCGDDAMDLCGPCTARLIVAVDWVTGRDNRWHAGYLERARCQHEGGEQS